MFKIWDNKTKTIFEINLNSLITEIEYEKEFNHFEAYEQNIKKNIKLIEEFLESNLKFYPIIEIVYLMTSEGKLQENIFNEITSEKLLLHQLMEDIIKEKNILDLLLEQFEKNSCKLRIGIKTRLENKKIFESFKSRILNSLRRRVNITLTSGDNFSSYEENLFVSVNIFINYF